MPGSMPRSTKCRWMLRLGANVGECSPYRIATVALATRFSTTRADSPEVATRSSRERYRGQLLHSSSIVPSQAIHKVELPDDLRNDSRKAGSESARLSTP